MDRITAARFVTPAIFALLAVVFTVLASLAPTPSGGLPNIARRTRARLALAFALVSLFLFWFHTR